MAASAPRAMVALAATGPAPATAATTPATGAAGVSRRVTVRLGGDGTRVATSTITHPDHKPTAATTWTGPLRPSRAAPYAGSVATASKSQVTRSSQSHRVGGVMGSSRFAYPAALGQRWWFA